MSVSIFALSTVFVFHNTLNVEAETVGAHVTKINKSFNNVGEVSVAFDVCSGSNHITYPQITISSDKESKTITMNRDVKPNTCHGGATILTATNLSSITAFLETETGDIAIDDITRNLESGKIAFHGMSNDGQILVEMTSTIPIENEKMHIDITFADKMGNLIPHVNYNLVIKQEGITVFNENKLHSHNGKAVVTTGKLNTDAPVDVDIVLNGIGLPNEDINWTGPKGELISFKVVPEFGTIAMMIMVVSILSIVGITAKSNGMFKSFTAS